MTKKKSFLGHIKKKIDTVHETGKNLSKIAAENAPDIHQKIKKHGEKHLEKGIAGAKKWTSFSGPKENIELLEKLGELRKSKVITEKEFQTKKKEILGKF